MDNNIATYDHFKVGIRFYRDTLYTNKIIRLTGPSLAFSSRSCRSIVEKKSVTVRFDTFDIIYMWIDEIFATENIAMILDNHSVHKDPLK